MTTLAFTWLIDPLPAVYPWMSEYWLVLVVPLVVAISLIYKGTRVENLGRMMRETVVMVVQILMLMVVAAVMLDGVYWLWLRVV